MINKKEAVIYMKLIDERPTLEYKLYYYKAPEQEYSEFYKFLLDSCIVDNNNVKEKKLKYLIDAYNELVTQLEEKYSHSKKCFNINLLKLCLNYKNKLGEYIEKGKKEYARYNEVLESDKDYVYYTNLSSWYSIKIDLTEKVVKNLCKENNSILNFNGDRFNNINIKTEVNISYVKNRW